MKWPLTLIKEAEMDSYQYFDVNIRPLPKKVDGTIDTLSVGFQDNDVDAFRHAYVSGVFSLEYSEKAALVLGWMNEFVFPSAIPDRNMDLWNNAIGRSLAKKHRSRKKLAGAVKSALLSGELIVTPKDDRTYHGASVPRPIGHDSVVVLNQSKTGANKSYFDFQTSRGMARAEFVEAIINGQYPGYEIRKIHGINVPVSKRDSLVSNNLG